MSTSPDADDDCDSAGLKIRVHIAVVRGMLPSLGIGSAFAQAEPNVTEVSAVASTTSTVSRLGYGATALVLWGRNFSAQDKKFQETHA